MQPVVRGWCPDLFTPMQSGDGWLVRLKPRLGRLTAATAAQVAAQAAACGSGSIELTGRGNLQFRGLTPDTAAGFARFAVAHGLASPDPILERIRTIQLTPLAGQAACAVADGLEAELARHPGLAALPGKFGFLIDAGAPLGPASIHADIILRAEGALWRLALHGRPEPALVTAREAPAVACNLALQWLASPGRIRAPRAAGRDDAARVIGWHAELDCFGIGLPFGQTDAGTLDFLAELSRRFGDGMLHCTPWRVLVLSGVSAASVPALTRALPGLIITHNDPRRLVDACVGNAGCASGRVDARADARRLLEAGIGPPGFDVGGHRAVRLHVSGCAKGCAHPGPATLTLVGGADGRYGLVRRGRASDTPQIDGLLPRELPLVLPLLLNSKDADGF